jgi:hypothetical protein
VDLTLGQKRRVHTAMLATLLQEMARRGYEPGLSEGYVGDTDPHHTAHVHRPDGGHYKGLAVDVNLFKCLDQPGHLFPCPTPHWYAAGADAVEAHRPFGTFWMTLHPLCRWDASDPNHYGLLDHGVA